MLKFYFWSSGDCGVTSSLLLLPSPLWLRVIALVRVPSNWFVSNYSYSIGIFDAIKLCHNSRHFHSLEALPSICWRFRLAGCATGRHGRSAHVVFLFYLDSKSTANQDRRERKDEKRTIKKEKKMIETSIKNRTQICNKTMIFCLV